MRALHYATALLELTKEGKTDEKISKNFVRAVVENGHKHLFPKITKKLEQLIAGDEKRGTIVVTSAGPLSESEVGKLLKKPPFSAVVSSAHKRVVRKEDETLIGGTLVRTSLLRVDATHKRALLNLYQKLTS